LRDQLHHVYGRSVSDTSVIGGRSSKMDGFIGEMRLMTLSYVPQGWLACDGTAYSPNAYTALYAVIGNIYGGSSTTFNVPDLRGVAVVEAGQCSNDPFNPLLGSFSGSTTVTLDTMKMPPHSHQLQGAAATPPNRVATGTGNWISSPAALATPVEAGDGFIDTTTVGPVHLNANTLSVFPGQSGAHDNTQPYLCLRYFICVEGEFPVRP
jgi:microcystin-dependent protein